MIELDAKPDCVWAATEALGDKWSPLLLHRFANKGPMTFTEIAETLPGMSPRTLSQRLTVMEDTRVIKRVKYNDRPVRYQYKLTKKGHDLVYVLMAMAEWGKRYGSQKPCAWHGDHATHPDTIAFE